MLLATDKGGSGTSVGFMGEEDGRGFVDAEYKPDQTLFRMRPERWLSGDYSKYGTLTP